MKYSAFLTAPVALCILALGAQGAVAANLVQNGSFENSTNSVSTLLSNPDSSVANWTNNGTFVLYCTAAAGTTCDSEPNLGGFQLAGPGNGNNNGLTSSPDGGSYMAFDSDPAFAGAFSQTIVGLTVGGTYTLSFYAGGAQEVFGGGPATTRTLTATLGNETFTTPVINTPGQGFTPWQLFSTTFTYTGGGDVLLFPRAGRPGRRTPVCAARRSVPRGGRGRRFRSRPLG